MLKTFVNSVASSFPKYKISQREEYVKLDSMVRKIKGNSQEAIDFSEKVINRANIDYRYTVHPLWKYYNEMLNGEAFFDDDIFLKNGFNPSTNERIAVWAKEAPKLCLESAKKAIEDAKIDKNKITDVVAVSTTGWNEPGICSFLIKNLGLNRNCNKLEVLFNGCFAGMTGLRTAKDIIGSDENRVALLVTVEIAFSQFSLSEEKDKVIANALFGDGSAAAILSHSPNVNGKNFEMGNFGNFLIDDTSSLMRWGYSEFPEVQEYSIFLSEEVPYKLNSFLNSDNFRSIIDRNIKTDRFGVACHPGGKAILTVVKKFFLDKYKLDKGIMKESFDTLRESGNIASVSIMLVLEKIMKGVALDKQEQEELFLIACGPGITIEWGKIAIVD